MKSIHASRDDFKNVATRYIMRQRATTIVASQARPFLSPVSQLLVFRVRLVRKFAERLNGVDLSNLGVGDCLDLRSKEAGLLMDEGWGELVDVRCEKEEVGKG